MADTTPMFQWVGPDNLMCCTDCMKLVASRDVRAHLDTHLGLPGDMVQRQLDDHVAQINAICGRLDKLERTDTDQPGMTAREQIEGYAARLYLAEKDLERVQAEYAGMSPGETARLRRLEDALIELGAPDGFDDHRRQTGQEPGSRMIGWIRNVVESRDNLEQERANRSRALAGALGIDVDAYDDMTDLVISQRTQLLTKQAMLKRVLEELRAAGMPATFDPRTDEFATWFREKLAAAGPYVWRAGDPPPPTHVHVLHDVNDENGLPYLCRNITQPDTWAWLANPDHAYDRGGDPFDRCTERDEILVQVYGGDL